MVKIQSKILLRIDLFVYLDEPMPGNDANSPSITNQLRNEELQRRQAVASNYDMFADDYSDTNVSTSFPSEYRNEDEIFLFSL